MFSMTTPSTPATKNPFARSNSPSTIVLFLSTPLIVREGTFTITSSKYIPGLTKIISPGLDEFTAS